MSHWTAASAPETRPRQRSLLICFTGIDGAGKSTQIEMLAERLRDDGWTTDTVWGGGRRPLTRAVPAIAKRLLGAPKPERAHEAAGKDQFTEYVTSTNRLFRRYRFLRRLWIDLSIAEHVVEADLIVLRRLLRGRAVICDRYLYRSIVSLAVMLDLTEDELLRLVRHPLLRLTARPTLAVLLDLPPEVAHGRRADVQSVEFLRRRAEVYRQLAAIGVLRRFDATQHADSLAAEIWQAVSGRDDQTVRQPVSLEAVLVTPGAPGDRAFVAELDQARGGVEPHSRGSATIDIS